MTNRLSLFSKLILGFILLASIPISVAVTWMFNEVRSNIQQSYLSSLETAANLQTQNLQTYLFEQRDNLKLLIAHRPLLSDFQAILANTGGLNQDTIIDKNNYDYLSAFRDKNGLREILLINTQGRILFTLDKGYELSASLLSDTFKDNVLAQAFNETRETGSPAISQAGFYPATRYSTIFITTPVFLNNEITGVLAISIDSTPLENLSTNKTGIDNSINTIIAIKDGNNMHFLSRLKPEGNPYQHHKTHTGSEEIRPMELAIKGQKGGGITRDFNGTEILAFWKPLPLINAGMVTKIDTEKAFSFQSTMARQILYITMGIFVFTLLIAIRFSKSLLNPISKLTEASDRIAQGDFTQKIDITDNNEFSKLGQAFNHMMDEVQISQEKLEARVQQRTAELEQSNTMLQNKSMELKLQSRALTESSAAILVTNAELFIDYVNPAFTKITGYQPEEVIGQHIRLIKSGKTKADTYKQMWNQLAAGNVWRGELRNKKKNGEEYWSLVSITPIRDDKGNINNFVSVQEDISERKKAAKVLQQNQDHLEDLLANKTTETQAIVDTAADAIVSISSKGIVLTFNKAAENMFGYNSHEVIGQNIKILMDKSIAVHHDEYLEHYQSTGEKHVIGIGREVEGRRKDGSKFPIYLSVSEMQLGDELRFTGIIRDISKQKYAEAELKKSRDFAEVASRVKSEFLANMSHEIRTPMNAIIGFSEIALQDQSLGENTKSNIQSIHSSSKSLLRLINDILDLSKLESGNLSLEHVDFHLPNLIKDILKTLEHQVNKKPLTIKKTCNSGIRPKVNGDPMRLRQVLINLLGNAIKFTEKGTITLSIEQAETPGILHFSVRDTGIGMNEQELSKVFKIFTQADTSTTRRFGGTGLGTSISKQLVEHMGGKIWAESQPGEGSIFHFTVQLQELENQAAPCLYEDETDIEVQEINSNEQPQAENKDGLVNGILLVEDNVFNQDLISQQLEACGYKADIAENGRIAIQMWKTGKYRLILSDISMPVMDGYQLVTGIREQEINSGHHIHMVAMTANAMAGEREKCLGMGFDDYLSKPVAIDSLHEVLIRWYPIDEPALPVEEKTPQAFTETTNWQFFNPETLAGFVGTEIESQKHLLNIFISDSPETMDKLMNDIENGDLDGIAAAAHKLKSSARALGADQLVEHLQAAENAAREGDQSAFVKSWDFLSDALENLMEEITKYLTSRNKEEQATISLNADKPWNTLKTLIIDDDNFILEQLKIFFNHLEVENIQFASQSENAMSQIQQQEVPFDLIVTDLNMPDIDGITLMRLLSERNYQGLIILISGEDRRLLNSVAQLGKAHKLNILGTLQKPFDENDLRKLLESSQSKPRKASTEQVQSEQLSEETIRRGLKENRLALHYQPKINLSDMSAISFEALARWHVDDQKILAPYLFIPVAEQSDLIIDLTDQVFKLATIQLAAWQSQGINCSVAVNFSMKALERIDLPDTLAKYCTQAGVEPGQLIIEVTESAIMDEVAVALEVISRLHLKGFKLSIDDFGTGYSSIDQLQKLPFSEIKLDRSFVSNATENPQAYAILESSISMGKKLGLSIVSEGVETQQDYELLKKLGSDIAQGYLFSKPLPAESVAPWLEEWRQLQVLE